MIVIEGVVVLWDAFAVGAHLRCRHIQADKHIDRVEYVARIAAIEMKVLSWVVEAWAAVFVMVEAFV